MKWNMLQDSEDNNSCPLFVSLHLLVIIRNRCAEIPVKHPALQIHTPPPNAGSLVLPPEIHPLTPLPRLHSQEEQNSRHKNNAPLPTNSSMFEDHMVDDRDIQHWENGDESGYDAAEQEFVPPNIIDPLREVFLRPGLHAEKGAAQIHHLPGEEQGEPGQAGEASRAGAEYGVAFRAKGIIAV
jgi:hypothetical protein